MSDNGVIGIGQKPMPPQSTETLNFTIPTQALILQEFSVVKPMKQKLKLTNYGCKTEFITRNVLLHSK